MLMSLDHDEHQHPVKQVPVLVLLVAPEEVPLDFVRQVADDDLEPKNYQKNYVTTTGTRTCAACWRGRPAAYLSGSARCRGR